MQLYNRLFIALLLLTTSFQSIAQSTNFLIQGTIKDSLGNPVNFASVSIIEEVSGAGLFFSQTNEQGFYSVAITDTEILKKSIAIKADAIGYFKAIKKISHIPVVINFVLTANIKALSTVTIKDDKPAIITKGDTLNYRITDFSNKNDRVIGDVLKKLPGIEVDANGLIKYNGKAINNFYIEGDNLLDDRYNAATNTIPSDIVDKVQVIENNQNIKMLNGIVPSDRAAINITLKNKNKLHFINTAKAGAGINNLYKGELNSMAFKNKFKTISSIKFNNTGNDLQDDVLPHNLNESLVSLENKTSELLSAANYSLSDIDKQKFLFNNARLVNTNSLVKLNSGTALKLNAFYVSDNQKQQYSSYTNYYLPGIDTIAYSEFENNNNKIANLHVQATVNINDKKRYFNSTLAVDYNINNITSGLITDGNSIHQQLNNTIANITNSLNGVKLFNGSNIVEYFSYTSYSRSPQTLYISPGLHQEILNSDTAFKQSIQRANIPSFFTNNYITYHKIHNHFFQSYKAGVLYQQQTLQSALDIQQLNNTISVLSDSFSNHLNWYKYKLYAEPELRWENRKNALSFSIPANIIALNYNDKFLQKSFASSYFFVTPSIKWQYKVGKESSLSAGYNYNRQFGDISQVYYGVIMQDYRTFTSNDAPVLQTLSHNLSAGFAYKKTLNILFFNIYSNYSFGKNSFIYSTLLQNNLTRRIALPYSNNASSFTVNSNLSKYLFPLKTMVTINYSFQYNSQQQLQNTILFPVANYSNFYSVSVRPKIASWLYCNYEINYNRFKSEPGNTDNKILPETVVQFKQLAEADILLKNRFYINVKGAQYFNKQFNNPSSSFIFADVSLRYNFIKTPFDIELLWSNLTNTNTYSLWSVSANSISVTNYQLRPRSFLCTFSFNF
ncbi:MAG: carboxypeptidase-like regulatory domain-containing protein [Parafilimonas sp.]